MLYVEGAQEEGGFHLLGHGVELGHYRAALAGDDGEGIVFDVGGGQVGGGLHQAGDVRGHLFHAVRAGQEGGDQVGGVPFCNGFLRVFHGLAQGFYAGVRDGEFFLQYLGEGLDVFLHFLELVGRDGNHGLCVAADGIGLVAAFQGDELVVVLHFRVEEADQLPQGVGAFLVDVVSAVAALGARDADLEGFPAFFDGLPLEAEGGGGVHASGAAYEHLPFVFRIQVDERLSFKEALLEAEGPVHARLFGNGEQAFQPAHGLLAFQQGQAGGDANPVIGPQRGFLGYHPAILYHEGNGLGMEVEVKIGVFLADHVLMGLQHQRGHVFFSGRCRLGDEHVARFVGFAVQIPLGRKQLKPGGHFFFMAGFPGNVGNFLEYFQDGFGIHKRRL